MFALYVLVIITISPSWCFDGRANNILVLDTDIFDDVVNKNQFVFIRFYASWCRDNVCSDSEFKEIVENATDLPVVFAQIESSNNYEFLNVSKFPTYKLFRRGKPIEYLGDFKSKNIIEWLQMHLKQITTLNTVQETEEFIRSNEKVLIGFFKDDKSKESQNYMEIATNFNNPTFAIVKNEEIFDVFHATDQSVILFNKLNDNSQIKFTKNLTLNNMKNFLDIYLRPVIVDLSSDAVSDVIFELPNILKYVIIFASKNDTNKTNSVLQSAKIVAEEYRNQIRFVLVDVDKDNLSSILEPFHISFNEIPGILFVSNIFKSTSSRYKITGNLSLKNIRSFVKYCNDDIIDDLLDEKLPEDWNKRAVYKLVKSNFLNVTHDFEKDVLVYMYVDNCNKCVKWENVIEDVAKTLANRENVIISKINIGLNGIDDKWYESTPSIVLFRKGDNKSVRYEGKANVEDIVRFIETVNIM